MRGLLTSVHFIPAQIHAIPAHLHAVIAAFLASCPGDKVMAAAHATAFYNCAGDIAAEGNPGPGTFRVRFMDALYDLTAPERAALLEKCWTKNGTRIVKEL